MAEGSPSRAHIAAFGCLAMIALAALALTLPIEHGLTRVPKWLFVPVSDGINVVIDAFNDLLRPVFRAISSALDWQLKSINGLLKATPWSVLIVVLALATYRVAGFRLAALTFATGIYTVFAGFWNESINTLSLIALGLPLACVLGAALGIFSHLNRRVAPVIDAILDIMQTVPAFAYLTPLIVLFGFGPVPGVIAAVIFGLPPMARNIKVGLDSTPVASIEAASIAGCNRWQMLTLVRFGAATRQTLIGLNQTIMTTLAMLILASVIGGFEDIGWEVLRAARRAEFGNGVMAGIVVTLLAVLLDRVSEAAIVGRKTYVSEIPFGLYWLTVAAIGALIWFTITPLLPPLSQLSMRQSFAMSIDQLVRTINVEFGAVLGSIKSTATTYFLLPLRSGLVRTMTPGVWGMALTPTVIATYCAAVSGIALLLAYRRHTAGAIGVLFFGLLLYTGFAGIPWLPLVAGMTIVGWLLGGPRLGLLAFAGLGGIALAGMWQSTMFAAYIMTAAILTSIVLGGAVGVLAAEYDGVSRVMRPINDLMQTIPPFVILLPLVTFFQVGDFSSFLAITAFAIVPMIRYTEKGLRAVKPTQLEAGQLAGCSPLQLLLLVKFPLARRDLVLGLNQTIMMALVMLAVAALVGSRGLGEDVYIALSKADPGLGLLAGLCIGMLAITTDRFMRKLAEA